MEECSSPEELKQVIKTIQKFQDRLVNRVKDLEAKKNSLKRKIEDIFQNIKKAKYTLYSIIIHEGVASTYNNQLIDSPIVISINVQIWISNLNSSTPLSQF